MKSNRLGIPNLEDFVLIPETIRGVKAPGSGATPAELKAYLEGHKYSDGLEIPQDEAVLYYEGNLIGSRGNILAITGRAKSRKSVIASAIMSSAFCDEFLGYSTTLGADAKVLNFDTEQGFGDWLEGSRRVIRDAQRDRCPPGFMSFHSRDCTVEMRLDLLRFALETYRPDVLVIDGIVDLVYDLNSQEEATKVGGELLTWSVRYNCLIIVVIHVTKGNGYMTGALGTYLEKKCQTAIKCEKDEDNDDLSVISCQYARRKPFAPFMIQPIKDNKGDEHSYERLGDDKIITKSTPPAKASPELKARLLNAVFNLHSAYQPASTIRQGIANAARQVGISSMTTKDVSKWIAFWQETGQIGPDPEGRICRVERLEIIEKIMPEIDFISPDPPPPSQGVADPEDLPF
jgi:hypothetical protein